MASIPPTWQKRYAPLARPWLEGCNFPLAFCR
jgi:hypothetical protein